jgi:methionine-rich copper-binding protein CopC
MFARTVFVIPVLVLALAIAACSDDNGPTAGETDTTPPSVSSAAAIDVNHIEVTFSENLQRTSAEDASHYTIVETTRRSAASAPDDTLAITVLALKSDQRTVSITTSMIAAPYDIAIAGVKDASGNAIVTPAVASFTGTADADATPPEIAWQSPALGATNVATGAPVEITFSERVSITNIFDNTRLTWVSGNVDLVGSTPDAVHFTLSPTLPLLPATRYTVTLIGVEDWEGNAMPDMSWFFTTAGKPDVTPPTIASSSPANQATNVDVESDISITFSEPMNQNIAVEWDIFPYVATSPPFGAWADQGRTLLITTDEPLADDTQYMVVFFQGHARDLAGNRLAQSSIHFTTGNALGSGGIAGRLTGDSQSHTAQDPTAAVLFAFTDSSDPLGSAVAAGDNTYDMRYLPDGDYYVYAILESDGDPDNLDPDYGDAFGLYGVDFRGGDTDEDVVSVAGGSRVTGRNFKLFDSSAITGFIYYQGGDADAHEVGVGLFDTSPFDPESPAYTTDASWPDFTEFFFGSYYNGPSSGTYYVGAFLDVNDNFAYDPGVDPVGFFGGAVAPNEVVVANGSDWNAIELYINDPPPGRAAATSRSSSWEIKPAKRTDWVGRLAAAMRDRERRVGK